MSLDELRSDPYAWVFVRRHHQARPRLIRLRRARRGLFALVGVAVVVVASILGASLIGAGPAPALGVSERGGSIVLSVRPGSDPNQLLGEVRAAFDDQRATVRVETMRGRDEVVGRLLGDGPGVTMVDLDPALDFTATEVLVAPGATGVVAIIVAGDRDLDLGTVGSCADLGRPLVEVRGAYETAGYDVSVTPVALDPAARTQPQFVADVTVLGSIVNIISQPASELVPSGNCR